MIELSNTSAQTVAVGQTVTFNTSIIKSRCGAESWRSGTGQVRLTADCATYEVSFNANVTGATASTPVQLTMYLSGAPLPETTMISTPATANAINNVSATTAIKNSCGDYDRIYIVNTGTTEINIDANPVLFVKRIA